MKGKAGDMWLFDQLFKNHDPATTAAAVAVTVSFIALTGTLLSALLSFIGARGTLYSNVVTAERSKWINALRENIANFSGKLRTLSFKVETKNIKLEERAAIVAESNNLISLILLQLNPFGKIERNVAIILKEMPNFADKDDGTKLRNADDLLLAHSRWLLKAEWQKVKYEARGPLIRPFLWVKEKLFLYRYDQFCRGEGSL